LRSSNGRERLEGSIERYIERDWWRREMEGWRGILSIALIIGNITH
jgi:hypothetical protein